MTAGVLAFIFYARLNQNLTDDLQTFIQNDYGLEQVKTHKLDELQTNFKCCGASDFLDWQNSKFVIAEANRSSSNSENAPFNLVAESCCKTPSKNCARRAHPSNIYFNVIIYLFIYIIKLK